jgi:hypothetical protein
MRQALLYETPGEFACMMSRHLEESLGVSTLQRVHENDPLLLRILMEAGEEMEVSLHNVFQTYQN